MPFANQKQYRRARPFSYDRAQIGRRFDCIQDHRRYRINMRHGGLTITEMLEKNKRKVDICNRLIIQCMYADEMVREYCYKNGLDISEESDLLRQKQIVYRHEYYPRGTA